MDTRKLKIPEDKALFDSSINNPDNKEDILPMPYSIINEVLNETFLHELNLKLHEIEQKKKDSNYEGSVKEYLGQNTIDIEGISCLSQPEKTHNHLLAGDKAGNLYLLDLAKKAIFSKKQIFTNKRVIKIFDSIISDGDTSITTAAVILQTHPIIYILRYKHSEPKLFLTHEIRVAPDVEDLGKIPFDCQLHDHSRLLTVKTYDGTIIAYRIPEVILEVDKYIKGTPVPLEQDEVKKILKYPLNMAVLEGDVKVIEDKVLELKFPGDKIPLKYRDVKAQFQKRKANTQVVEDPGKKDPKKKEEKKPEIQEEQIPKEQYQYNQKVEATDPLVRNGMDESAANKLPKYEPFIYICSQPLALPKNRYFQKSKIVELVQTVIYGWKQTKMFKIAKLSKQSLKNIPEYLHLVYHHEKLKEDQSKQLQQYMGEKLNFQKEIEFSNVHEITATFMSKPDQSLLAFGLKDGTISLWNPYTYNLEYNSQKHQGAVTCIRFFEKWKMVSGNISGEVFIHDIVQHKNEIKRTNIFQPKTQIQICNIEISDLGIAHVIDSESNMRIYDLWRNEKIAKLNPCTYYAMLENKGRKWLSCKNITPCQPLYTNRDFTVIISTNWPNFNMREEDRTPQQKQKYTLLRQNPWQADGTNLHVIRNFQIILNLFEGLESTYKKGYERKKIQNLFSNLQFAQLYDRNFQIPDFGHPPNMKKIESHTKSLFSSLKTHQHQSEKSFKDKTKRDPSESNKNVKLTNEILHPEKFLLQRRKIDKDLMVTTEGLVGWLREQHQRKEHRENKLLTDTSKGVF